MEAINQGDLLWNPSNEAIEATNLYTYQQWLKKQYGLTFPNYQALHSWSINQLEQFWASIWEYTGIIGSARSAIVLQEANMPGAVWFPDARLNYAENIFAKQRNNQAMIFYQAEDAALQTFSYDQIYQQAWRLADALRQIGVKPGDRVVGYLPNIPEAIVALLAAASIGAVWSCCAPDFGSRSVLDRFSQIEPIVLIAVDGYSYGGKWFDRRATLAEIQASLPSLQHTILITNQTDRSEPATLIWQTILQQPPTSEQFIFEQLPFSHPLWILYSSGTTGLPKPIVQSHGGILLEHAKAVILHNDLKPADRFFWFTSTGWMMWNYLVGSLLSGCSIVLYNGSPAWPTINALWELAERVGISYFGTSAAFIMGCIKAEIKPNQQYNLARIRALGSTGSPLTSAGFEWIYHNVNPTLALESISGGTDVCTAFVGGIRTQPIYAGEIQGAFLGADVQSFGADGKPVIDQVGELVITKPMPSMPLYFWNDPDGERYRASYFELFPGVWRHGDWIMLNQRGGCVIYGRSDSTINRQGIRMGTSEIYRVVESLPEIRDSLVIDLELLGHDSAMLLFVVLQEGAELHDQLKQQIRQRLRTDISPRHLPDQIHVISEVPYTLSGKKMEVPIRRILLGHSIAEAVSTGSMRNPAALDYFIEYRARMKRDT